MAVVQHVCDTVSPLPWSSGSITSVGLYGCDRHTCMEATSERGSSDKQFHTNFELLLTEGTYCWFMPVITQVFGSVRMAREVGICTGALRGR
jgi:hypothetical protein